MGSRDFYTDKEIQALEAAHEYRPLLEEKDRKIKQLQRIIRKLKNKIKEKA